MSTIDRDGIQKCEGCGEPFIVSDSDAEHFAHYCSTECETDARPVRVIFRVYKGKQGGDVIALFPDLVADHRGHCTCYQHVGQHGAADYAHVMRQTRPATEAECAPLRRELVGPVGYLLIERRRHVPRAGQP